MKTAAKISILLNVALLGGLIFLLTQRRLVISSSSAIAQPAVETAPTANSAPAAPSAVSAELAPFRWSQLDSKDYHIYVKNLRAIGCPEPTVRAIVTADVHSVYLIFAGQIERKLANLANGSWTNALAGGGSEEALKDELQHLPGRESAKIADLLGETVAAPDQETRAVAAVPMVVPLALQPLDFKTAKLEPDQIQAINDLRQRFIDKLGGPNQDTNDPAYQQRWQQLQTETDDAMEGIVGNEAFQDLQLQLLANAQAAQEQPAGNQ